VVVFRPVLPSVDVLTLVAFETLKISVPTMVEAALGPVSPTICDNRLADWSRNLVRQARIQLTVDGRGNLRDGETYVVMSNHQSHYDIPVLFQALGVPIRMVAKKELFRIPFMNTAMRAAGFVEVDRGNRQRAIQSLAHARAQLSSGVSVWIAPEGTRSDSGRLGPFKKGGFYLAENLGLRILPVTIVGTREVLPARGLHVTRGRPVHVTVSSPIDPNAFGPDKRRELISAVREAISQHLPSELQSVRA
jgi:1-acyl-sn-glycerol-3-phosphate acyltransferase